MAKKAKDSPSDLSFTGERIVPQADNCEPNFASRMHQEHIVRYSFAAQLVAGKTVLDVGCGVGYGSQYLAQAGAKSIRSFDLSEDAIKHARTYYAHPAIDFSVGNAEVFDFDQKFDIVTCFELIEHVMDPYKVVDNIRRSLAPDGILLMSTPRALEKKRTHFHTKEFTYDEFVKMLCVHFPSLDLYFENNHFSSLITNGKPSDINRVVCLKDQYSPEIADVFIAVAGPSIDMRLPTMQASMCLDNDAYVTMLERDVDILRKAENDARDLLDHMTRASAEREAFKDKEIARLTTEYNFLFLNKEDLTQKLWHFERSIAQQANLAETRSTNSDLEGRVVHLEAANRDKDSEIECLKRAYETLYAENESNEAANRHQDSEIECLKRAYETLYAENESNAALLWGATMKTAELEHDVEELRSKLEALTVRITDADARRAEAYDFARVSSDRAHGLQRDIDGLKRDIAEVLEMPKAASNQIYDHRHRDIVESMQRIFLGTEATRAIGRDPLVDRVARVAMEAEEKRAAAAQSEGVLKQQHDEIAGLHFQLQHERSELQSIRAELHGCQNHCAALQEQVCDIQRQADDLRHLAELRQGQIDRLRNSVSWRITALLRKLPPRGGHRR